MLKIPVDVNLMSKWLYERIDAYFFIVKDFIETLI
jgi:hypothetical protein